MAARENPSAYLGDSEHELREFAAGLVDEWITLVVVVALFVAAGALHLANSPAIYRTDALLQLEDERADFSGLNELSNALGGENPTAAELEILKSRSVLLPTVEALGLAHSARPDRFPLIGGILAKRHSESSNASGTDRSANVSEAWFGLEQYAWGGEEIEVEVLDVPRQFEGLELPLTALGEGRYRLDDPIGNTLIESTEGALAESGDVRLRVSKLVARPGTRFFLRKQNALARAAALRGQISALERGRKTGILELRIDGQSPELIASILNHVADVYVRQSIERKSADAAAMREFLNEQLPVVKRDLSVAEAALNEYRVQSGSVDLSLEAQGLLTQLAEVETGLSGLELERAAREQRFTGQHPSMIGLADQHAELMQLRRQLKSQMRELPKSEQDSFQLMRDVRVANELYTVLLNRAQELKVLQAGTIGDVRVVDSAFVPIVPIGPRKGLTLSVAALLGCAFGIIFVIVRRALDGTIHDPLVLESLSGLPVFASIPHSKTEEASRGGGDAGQLRRLLASNSTHDPAIESLRSLRTSLEFLLATERAQVLTICGSAPGVGKSFTSSNLAAVMAAADKRVVLIDGDMRRGSLHKLVGQPRGPGLSELLAGTTDLEQAVYSTTTPNLKLIPTGALPPNPSELVSEEKLGGLLSKLESEFELIVIDSPPVLAASEAIILARAAAVSLMVVRSEKQVRREIDTAMKHLKQGGADLRGFVFNDVKVRSQHYYYGY